MTISTRITLGISAAAVSLGLALAPVAVALDAMKKDDGMKKDSMSKDTMSKDAMKKDTMSKDTMKKDDGMKKDGMLAQLFRPGSPGKGRTATDREPRSPILRLFSLIREYMGRYVQPCVQGL